MAETKWIKGSGRIKRFEAQGDKKAKTIINLSLSKESLDSLYVSKAGYVFISLVKKDAPDQYKNEFYISEDSWSADNARQKDGESADEEMSVDDPLFGDDGI